MFDLQRQKFKSWQLHFHAIGKPFIHICLCHQAVSFETSQMAIIPIPMRNVTHFTSTPYNLNHIALITVINSYY